MKIVTKLLLLTCSQIHGNKKMRERKITNKEKKIIKKIRSSLVTEMEDVDSHEESRSL